ncbi:MAG TPA: hypothetical protein DEP84_23015 [Chloroflexi bacterium]|nr:hypothetical protein [Chloroflexota bacterium]
MGAAGDSRSAGLGLLEFAQGTASTVGSVLDALTPELPPSVQLEALRSVREPGGMLVLAWLSDFDEAYAVLDAISMALQRQRASSIAPQTVDRGPSTVRMRPSPMDPQRSRTEDAAPDWRLFPARLHIGTSDAPSPLANVILREIEPDSVAGFLAPLESQMERVAQRPGCLGIFLGQELGNPGGLLGITRWSDLDALQAYLDWPGAHAFRPVVEPLTRAVPLRFLGQPL